MAPNASGRGREDEANDKRCVERMFKKQLSPQSLSPLFFQIKLGALFARKGTEALWLVDISHSWVPYWKQWNYTAFAYWVFRPQTFPTSTQFPEVGSQAGNWQNLLGIVTKRKILKMLILAIPQEKSPSNHLTVKARANKPLGRLRISK